MGLKTDLKQIIRVYGEHENNIKKKIDDIKKDEKWSDEYKKRLIENVKKSGIEGKRKMYEAAIKSINDYKENLLNSRRPIKKDYAFELRLNNALKMVELAGKEMKPEELTRIVEPFKEDFGTMQMLRHVFNAQGIKSHEIIPLDNIDSQIEKIDYVGKIVAHCLHPEVEPEGTEKLSMSVAVEMLGDGEIGIHENADPLEGAGQ